MRVLLEGQLQLMTLIHTDASTQVVKITSTNGTGEVWQGYKRCISSSYKLTSSYSIIMQLDVYSTSTITIAPKAQGGVSGAPDSVTSARSFWRLGKLL
jgi:hypothetical protein